MALIKETLHLDLWRMRDDNEDPLRSIEEHMLKYQREFIAMTGLTCEHARERAWSLYTGDDDDAYDYDNAECNKLLSLWSELDPDWRQFSGEPPMLALAPGFNQMFDDLWLFASTDYPRLLSDTASLIWAGQHRDLPKDMIEGAIKLILGDISRQQLDLAYQQVADWQRIKTLTAMNRYVRKSRKSGSGR